MLYSCSEVAVLHSMVALHSRGQLIFGHEDSVRGGRIHGHATHVQDRDSYVRCVWIALIVEQFDGYCLRDPHLPSGEYAACYETLMSYVYEAFNFYISTRPERISCKDVREL